MGFLSDAKLGGGLRLRAAAALRQSSCRHPLGQRHGAVDSNTSKKETGAVPLYFYRPVAAHRSRLLTSDLQTGVKTPAAITRNRVPTTGAVNAPVRPPPFQRWLVPRLRAGNQEPHVDVFVAGQKTRRLGWFRATAA